MNKTIDKASAIGTKMNLYNARRKRVSEAIAALKEKNAPLKKFDELEGMLNSYEQILFHNHLFTDAEESHLTKLDLFYANQHYVYNDVIVSTTLSKTIGL